MKMNFDSITKAMKDLKFSTMCHKPEIMTIVGITSMVVGTVIACVQSTKLESVACKKESEMWNLNRDLALSTDTEEMITNKRKKETVLIYSKMVGNVVLLYLPSVLLIGGGAASILVGVDVLKKRNAALIAAYAALNTSYKKYREEVTERYGSDVDNDIYLGQSTKKIKKIGEDGQKTTELVKVQSKDPLAPYHKLFDEATSRYYEKDIDMMKFFLYGQERLANERLSQDGFLFLNDVLDALGLEKTQAGQVVGWRYDHKEGESGDGHVSFGLNFDLLYSENPQCDAAVEMDFNVDGPIIDTLEND